MFDAAAALGNFHTEAIEYHLPVAKEDPELIHSRIWGTGRAATELKRIPNALPQKRNGGRPDR